MSANEDTPVELEEIANQATAGLENSTISEATVLHAHAGDEGFYVELENNLAAKSTRKLTTLLAGYAAALFGELEEPRSMTIVGHMKPKGKASATVMVELDPYDFETLDESDVAFRQRVIENIERVI